MTPTDDPLPLPEPVQGLQEYISQHSFNVTGIQLGIGYLTVEYACPHCAGNIMLLNYINSMLLAISTNRTMLWHYIKGSNSSLQDQCDRVSTWARWILPLTTKKGRFKLDQRQDLLDACEHVLKVL